jgi:hypothetical protein
MSIKENFTIESEKKNVFTKNEEDIKENILKLSRYEKNISSQFSDELNQIKSFSKNTL